ncbi:MAG TPA: DUF2914 domain-containing protein [Burkholderiales bacterium]
MSLLEPAATAPADPPGVSTSTFKRLRLYAARNEHRLSVTFFIAGFLFDILTLGRIDSWFTIGQQAIYLFVISLILVQMLRAEAPAAAAPAAAAVAQPDAAPVAAFATSPAAAPAAGGSRLRRRYLEYRNPAIHFLLGALLSAYTLFFFKSSSLLVSFGFMGVLVALLVANESARFKALGLPFKFALLGLCYLAFFAYVVPVLIGQTGLAVFLLSMALGCVPLAAVAFLAARERKARILVPLGCVLVFFLTFYLLRIIPPVPLSIPFMGVYHGVERTDEGYRLTHERPFWRIWHNGDQRFRAQDGDKVHVYFRIFSPSRFSDQVLMGWYRYEGGPKGRGWALQDTIPIKIVGGREEGFRGYGVKTNYQPGKWMVEVETTDRREIGRIYFSVESVSTPLGLEARSFAAELD